MQRDKEKEIGVHNRGLQLWIWVTTV